MLLAQRRTSTSVDVHIDGPLQVVTLQVVTSQSSLSAHGTQREELDDDNQWSLLLHLILTGVTWENLLDPAIGSQ
ncbi:hypothetical protein FVEG_06163 [Fusarium verticillioides 7600]|uniref:Uncharacterized protein n=1 Tax=Gibberella moniliformis (strain M3125 / FGSC 7600) TaxID=334819 RepID=W7MCP6_GIBM7|nr:hypothetical protein FVEG_06163 [Fusarium verticillioides 7600]EWG45339.1 hypothetical protein FVEG_06163 [Fusarium verticillioides 7600]